LQFAIQKQPAMFFVHQARSTMTLHMQTRPPPRWSECIWNGSSSAAPTTLQVARLWSCMMCGARRLQERCR
jgi:hypothetical protein